MCPLTIDLTLPVCLQSCCFVEKQPELFHPTKADGGILQGCSPLLLNSDFDDVDWHWAKEIKAKKKNFSGNNVQASLNSRLTFKILNFFPLLDKGTFFYLLVSLLDHNLLITRFLSLAKEKGGRLLSIQINSARGEKNYKNGRGSRKKSC